MLSIKLTSTALAASLALVPATRVAADSKDFIAGALLGGVAGAIIQKEVRKKKALEQQQQQQLRARTRAPQATYAPKPRKYTPRKTYRPSIPATSEGRDIQSALTYFGFDAGTVDGRVGPKTRSAITAYQRYMGYEGTGTLTSFQRHLLTSSYLRAEAGGATTLGQIAGLPDGTRGLLKVYRQDLASGATQQRTLSQVPSAAYTDL
ncbi:peptidoglycan-binding domain-containing protein [uncultured Tateyamaria sp.]|uniref:peptidoglycan-binding domain-containing protein n=1 Tax=uncultured Tateyamaria sp. TaxID=455651 RepID=UPI002605E076|nr:peptidoglycan-binding domain-containing protein [uncultured Tateyamaria sp.]